MGNNKSPDARPGYPNRRIKRAQLMARMDIMCEGWHMGTVDEFRMGIYVRSCVANKLGPELHERRVDPSRFRL